MSRGLHFWHRPVRRRHVVVVMSLVVLAWLTLLGLALGYVLGHWQAEVLLRHQGLSLRLPEGMTSRAQVLSPLATRIDTQSSLAVPVDQMVKVSVVTPLAAHARLKTTVPVDTSVHVDQDIPVETRVKVQVPLVSWLPSMTIMVPLRLTIPVHMVVPVHLQFPLALDVKVSGSLLDPLSIPIRTTMHVKMPVKSDLAGEVMSQTDFRLQGLQAPFDLTLERAQLKVPLSHIKWCQSMTCVPSSTTWLAGSR